MRIYAIVILYAGLASAQTGQQAFEKNCSVCHGGDGGGGEMGPPLGTRVANLDDENLTRIIQQGLPSRGMPGFNLPPAELSGLVAHVRTFRRGRRRAEQERRRIELTDGRSLEGLVVSQSFADLQLRTDDKRLHLLRPEGSRFREVTSETAWPTYNGDVSGNRFTPVTQINKESVGKLGPRWVFQADGAARMESTPVVIAGIMYVTSANECWALDAGVGRELWHFQRPRTKGLAGNAAGGFNRGVAAAGERIFMVTDNAHLLALNRMTGEVLWETEMADWRQNYNVTSAPLVAGDLVISGTAGGEQGVRGFLAAYDQTTGKEAWRFWTVPKAGEPGSETWQGKGIEHGSAAAWFTGTYDPGLDLIYWPTGNPGPDYNDAERGGDNLYSCSLLALEAKTGKLRWYYQFTPHDVFDWDATEPPVLIDAAWQGQPRKLVIQANRNGFFYVLDRTDGKLLLAEPFVKKLTWAKSIGKDGRPVYGELEKVAGGGTKVCPSQAGAANWTSTSYNPGTHLYYVQTLEHCNVYTKRPVTWEAGRGYLGGSSRSAPSEVPQKILRAISPFTGKVVWELPQPGRADSWGGVLSTASGLVFFGDDSGMFAAADATTGKPLWHFGTNQIPRASPMTYVFDGKQFIAVAMGSDVLAFALPD